MSCKLHRYFSLSFVFMYFLNPVFAEDNPRSQDELPTAEEMQRIVNQADTTQTTVSPRKIGDPIKLRDSAITLRAAVSTAVNLNQTVSKDRYEVERFKWDYIAHQASRLPKVRTLGFLTQQTLGGNTLVPSRLDALALVSATVPVTQQYRLGLEARAIKLAREVARYKLNQEIDETIAKVKSIYYKVVLDQTKVQTLEITIKYLKELQTTTSNRLKEGSALKVDVMKVDVALEKSDLELMRAKDDLQIDAEKFNHLLGKDITSTITLDAIPPPEDLELDLANAEDRALNRRPEIKAADARLRQVQLEKRIRMAQYIPNISAGVVYIGLPGFNNDVVPKHLLAPGLFFSYDAFDCGRRAFLAKAQAKSEKAESFNLANLRDEVLIDLHTQINKLTEARKFVKTSKHAREVAQEDLRVTMNRYKYTSDKLAEVLAATSALAAANDTYQQSLLAFWEAKAQFDRSVGE